MRISDWSSDVCSSDLAAVELAREVHWVNARRLCEALKRVGPAKFILDLLQHGMEPWQRRARYLEASAPGELGEQGGYHIGDGYRSEEHKSELQSLMSIS